MTLRDILKNVTYSCDSNNFNIFVSDIIYNSRKIKEDCVFVCLEGSNVDGHDFVQQAVDNGAVVIVAQHSVNVDSVPVIIVNNTREALAIMSANFFDNPANEIITIGLTGTKGKTTTSCMIKSILEKSGQKVGVIGTLGILIGDSVIKTNNTTPESYEIQKYLRKMIYEGCSHVVMEVSSLGLKWGRVSGFEFDYGIFTNFFPDHIGDNEHESVEDYLYCKSMLFKKCKVGIVNKDDNNVNDIIKDHTCEISTFGFSNDADFIASNQSLISSHGYLGVHFDVSGRIDLSVNVDIPGSFSVYNAIAAIAVCSFLNVSKEDIIDGLDKVKVKGRFEVVPVPGNYTLIIDYAHNAMSMENILLTLREYKPNRLITLFGAGGNRDKSRRYEMGEVSGQLSDLSIITEDNSRFEDVKNIISDIMVGVSKTNGKYDIVPNRRDAIRYCMEIAQDGDIIVLAGKGHEDYQEIMGVKYHFDEREVIEEIISELKKG